MVPRYLIFLVACFLAVDAAGQEVVTEDSSEEKARALFAYEVGTWDSRWERLDAEGNVASEITGTETFSYTLDNTALYLETRVEGRENWNRAIKFYSPKEKKIIFIDVGTDGDYWLMSQDVETEIVESQPNVRPNGRSLIIRFTITRKTDNEQDVVMDSSVDGGETWQRRTRQYMQRSPE